MAAIAQDRLLDTAIREFGTHGLEGVSTRQIAKVAGTAMSSLTDHCGGKEQLYLAAAKRIAEVMADDFAPVLDAKEGVDTGDRHAARAAIQRTMGRFVEKMAGTQLSDHSLFIAREQMSPTAAFDALYVGIVGRLVRRLRELVCITTGVTAEEATHATLTLIGQAMVSAPRAPLFCDCSMPPPSMPAASPTFGRRSPSTLDRMAERHATTAWTRTRGGTPGPGDRSDDGGAKVDGENGEDAKPNKRLLFKRPIF